MIFNIKLGQDDVEILKDYYLELKELEEEIRTVRRYVKVRMNNFKCCDNDIKLVYSRSTQEDKWNKIAEDSLFEYNILLDEGDGLISALLQNESVFNTNDLSELFMSYLENRRITKAIKRDFFDDSNYLMGIFSLIDIKRLDLPAADEWDISVKNKIKEKLISVIPVFMINRFLNKRCNTKELEEYKQQKEKVSKSEIELKNYVYLLLQIITHDESILERYKDSMKI